MSAIQHHKNQTSNKAKKVPQLKIIRGGLFPTTKREKRIEQFWLLCQTAFWNTQTFTDAEKHEFKTLIAEHFRGSKNVDKTFKQLAERVCLAKRYVSRRQGRYISKPIDWLNIHYKYGLSATASWLDEVEKQRETVPHYNEGIALFAKALLNYCERKNPITLLLHRREFIRLKQYDLLQVYTNCIMQIQYFNF